MPPGRPLQDLGERVSQRFWAKVHKTDECWFWTGYIRDDGYGNFPLRKTVVHRAHRIAYAIGVGPIPAGMVVCHRCDTRACVRPDHLFLGTQLDNIADRNAKNRQAKGIAHPAAKLTDDDVVEIRRRYAVGSVSQHELAAEYGINNAGICRIVRRKIWTHVGGDDAGYGMHLTLNDDTVREIRTRYAAGGITQTQLAIEYGVTNGQISRVVNRKKWKHVS